MTVADSAAGLSDIHSEKKSKMNLKSSYAGENYLKIKLTAGRNAHIAPNFLVAAICENTGITGKDVGKIEIYDDYSVVGVPESIRDQMISDLDGIKICGKPVKVQAFEYEEKPRSSGKKQKTYGKAAAYKPDGRSDKAQKSCQNKRDGKKPSPSANRKSTHGKYSVNKSKKRG